MLLRIVVEISVLLLIVVAVKSLPCVLKNFQYGTVCVCNSSYCDTLEDVNPNGIGNYILVSSSKGGLRFSKQAGSMTPMSNLTINDSFKENTFKITVNQKVTYQKIVGFGGAFTGSVLHNIQTLQPELRKQLYKSYFSLEHGIGYNMLRIPIGGSDFDLAPWAYNEVPPHDKELGGFTKLDDRDVQRLEEIKVLKSASNNENIKFIGTAWSPPPWMKSNNQWSGLSVLRYEYYQTWADYHLKFLQLMSEKNVTFWAITTGNEPLNGIIGWAFVKFMSLGWIARDQGEWLGRYLGPTIRTSAFNDIKLLGGDDQRYTFPWWFARMEAGYPKCTDYLDGFGVHWYWDKFAPPSLLDNLHNTYPDKLILNTESCLGDKPFTTHGPELGSWERAEDYIHSYIEDLTHWVNGWVDWNLLLDQSGGPNYVNNTVEAAVISSTDGTEIFKQPIFYAIGHFSRFFVPESKRVDVKSSNAMISCVGFQRPDGSMAIVFYNANPFSVDIVVEDNEKGQAKVRVPSSSLHTFIYA